LFFAISKKLPN